jgi:RES domain-containing protein
VQVWRICKQKHLDSAFSGIGGLYAPARWTPQGFLVVYTAQSLALASLEVFVHTQSDRIPLVAIRAFLPENIAVTTVDVSSLPENWQSYSSLSRFAGYW